MGKIIFMENIEIKERGKFGKFSWNDVGKLISWVGMLKRGRKINHFATADGIIDV